MNHCMTRIALTALVLIVTAPAFAAELAMKPVLQYSTIERQPTKGMLLIARRDMPDLRFRKSVILLASHDDGGTLGLIINRSSTSRLENVLPEVAQLNTQGHTVYFGGPVALHSLIFLVRHNSAPEEAIHVMDDLYLSGDGTTLKQMLKHNKTNRELRVYIGYAGWAAGQLAGELDRNDWYLHKATLSDVFNQRNGRIWDDLIEQYEPAGQLAEQAHPPQPLHLAAHASGQGIP